MNQILLKKQPTPMEADYVQWCAEQGAQLRTGKLSELDRENLAEEIESLGRSDRKEISSGLGVLLSHLLKIQFQPEKRKANWLLTIREQLRQIGNVIEESPSLRTYPGQQLAREYEFARLDVMDETGLTEQTFPGKCPYLIKDVLDQDFFPGAPWSRDDLIRQ